ncbi:MAG: XRE family transcriptional regulator [Pseudomonadota bacterium]
MQHTPSLSPHATGADLRALRKARGLTLTDLAIRLGRSVGWLSQVERDKSAATLPDLRDLAQALDVPMAMLLRKVNVPDHEARHIVRRGNRRSVGSHLPGLVEELLSPDLTDDFEMVHSTFHPGTRVEDTVTRPTKEVAFLLQGRLDLEIAGVMHVINPGDSFRIRGEPFRWANPYPEAAVAIWVIAPPVY